MKGPRSFIQHMRRHHTYDIELPAYPLLFFEKGKASTPSGIKRRMGVRPTVPCIVHLESENPSEFLLSNKIGAVLCESVTAWLIFFIMCAVPSLLPLASSFFFLRPHSTPSSPTCSRGLSPSQPPLQPTLMLILPNITLT
jgi:hypothetical protein